MLCFSTDSCMRSRALSVRDQMPSDPASSISSYTSRSSYESWLYLLVVRRCLSNQNPIYMPHGSKAKKEGRANLHLGILFAPPPIADAIVAFHQLEETLVAQLLHHRHEDRDVPAGDDGRVRGGRRAPEAAGAASGRDRLV